MSEEKKSPSRYREYGGENKYIPAGPFKIHLPFVHYAWSVPEMIQAAFMCATCLSAIPVLTEYLGVTYDVAWSMVIINGLGYSFHVLLGDPVVPGWVTPAIPIITAYLANYELGPTRFQALFSIQITLGIIFLILGITGLGGKLVEAVPQSVKAGVLMGGGIAAIYGEFKAGGRFGIYPISVSVGFLCAYFCLFSPAWAKIRQKNKFCNTIGKFGMLPAIIIGVFVGPIVGEFSLPSVEFWPLFKMPEFSEIIKLSVLTVGFPSASLFISCIPTGIVAYIIAFGDFVTAEELLVTATRKDRADEFVDFNANRSNLVSAIRNIAMAFVCPYTQMCGPLWAAVTAAIGQRYKEGPEAMESIWSGVGTFRICTFFAVALRPIASFLQPVLPVALSMTLLVQGYVCTQLAMQMSYTDIQKGVCGTMGTVLACKGAAWGLAVGLILYFLLKEDKENEKAMEAKYHAVYDA